MLLQEEKFVEYLWEQGFFPGENVAGKRCLIVGGEYLPRENYATILNTRLMQLGAVRCDNTVLFTSHILDSYCDLIGGAHPYHTGKPRSGNASAGGTAADHH